MIGCSKLIDSSTRTWQFLLKMFILWVSYLASFLWNDTDTLTELKYDFRPLSFRLNHFHIRQKYQRQPLWLCHHCKILMLQLRFIHIYYSNTSPSSSQLPLNKPLKPNKWSVCFVWNPYRLDFRMFCISFIKLGLFWKKLELLVDFLNWLLILYLCFNYLSMIF